jgi:hypothetical protein
MTLPILVTGGTDTPGGADRAGEGIEASTANPGPGAGTNADGSEPAVGTTEVTQGR